MNYNYRIIKNNFYLHLQTEGTVNSLADIERLTQSVLDAAHAGAFSCILFDNRNLKVDLTPFDITNLAEGLVDLSVQTSGTRAAIVCPFRRKESSSFFETAYRNRSLELRVFHEMDKAEVWLKNKISSQSTLTQPLQPQLPGARAVKLAKVDFLPCSELNVTPLHDNHLVTAKQ